MKNRTEWLGNWRIIETGLWDQKDLDLVSEAMLILEPKGRGHINFIAAEAQLDYRITKRDGEPCIEFTFHGFDEGDEMIGRGYATLDGDKLRGQLFFFNGDDSSFVAKRQLQKRPSG